MDASATFHWFFSGTCIACQQYDIQGAPNRTITSLCGFAGVLEVEIRPLT